MRVTTSIPWHSTRFVFAVACDGRLRPRTKARSGGAPTTQRSSRSSPPFLQIADDLVGKDGDDRKESFQPSAKSRVSSPVVGVRTKDAAQEVAREEIALGERVALEHLESERQQEQEPDVLSDQEPELLHVERPDGLLA